MMNRIGLTASVAAVAVLCASMVFAQQSNVPELVEQHPPRPTFSADGVVRVPTFDLPPSVYLSAEALAVQQGRANVRRFDVAAAVRSEPLAIEQLRAGVERQVAGYVAAQQERYAVDVVEQTIGGVDTRVFTPQAGEADRQRVLIHLHGGGFTSCAVGCALLESIPIAAVGRFKVISVDYRMSPEHVFPAASEDIAAVYREPDRINTCIGWGGARVCS